MDNKTNPQKSLLISLALANAIATTGFGIIFPIFPQLLADVGGGNALDLGTMAAAFGFAYFIASPIFGNLADYYNNKVIILIGLIGFSTSNLVYIYAQTLWHFYIARIIEGAFSSAILPPSLALITRKVSKDNRAKLIGYIYSANTFGLIVGPLLGGVLYDGLSLGSLIITGSVYLPFWVSLTVGLLSFMVGYLFISEENSNPKETNNSNQKISKKNPSSLFLIIKRQIKVIPIPFLVFLIFIIVDTFGILSWLLVSPGFIFYFYDELFLSASDFGYFVAGYGLFAALGQAFLGNLSDKYGRKKIIFIGQIFSILFYIFLPVGSISWHFVLISIFAGIGSGLRDPALKALLTDVTSEDSRATVFGIESGLISISQIFGPILGGLFYELYGISFVFQVSLFVSSSSLLFIFFLNFKNV